MAEVLVGLLASSNSSSRLLSVIVNPSFEKICPNASMVVRAIVESI